MKPSLVLFLASAGLTWAQTRQCSAQAFLEKGNWFCGEVEHIRYERLPRAKGSYDDVVSMGRDGKCIVQEREYESPLGPLAQDLSIHFRGPLNLKQAAVYNMRSGCKESSSRQRSRRRRAVKQQRLAVKQQKKRAVWVTATINGQVVSWENDWSGQPSQTPSPTAASADTPAATSHLTRAATTTTAMASSPGTPLHTSAPGQTTSMSNAFSNTEVLDDAPPELQPLGCEWQRISYYNAEQRHAENMIFMGNYGGQGSGVFDTVWGNSLAYLNAHGNAGSPWPQVLNDVDIQSNQEFSILSGEKCDESCGFMRVPELAYKGFGGADKVFLFQFSMPYDGDRGFNGDKPAIWALNARVARTGQYTACSCWRSGCGEVDIYEVLASGDNKCKSTFHLASHSGGSSDWFERPSDASIKVAVVFDSASSSVSIHRLDPGVDFAQGLDSETVQAWLRGQTSHGNMSSLFQMGS